MPIPVSCPSCGTGLKAPDTAAGRRVKCPKCATPFAVPAVGEAAAFQAPPPPPSRPRQAAAPPRGYEDDADPYEPRPGPRQIRRAPPAGAGLQLGLGIASLAV